MRAAPFYRFEDSNGMGPFNADFLQDSHLEPFVEAHLKTDEFPTPFEEPKIMEQLGLGDSGINFLTYLKARNKLEDLRAGADSLREIERWFPKDLVAKYQEVPNHSFSVHKYLIPKDKVIHGVYQSLAPVDVLKESKPIEVNYDKKKTNAKA